MDSVEPGSVDGSDPIPSPLAHSLSLVNSSSLGSS